MSSHDHAGVLLKLLRKQRHLSQTQLATKTQLVDGRGISVVILSGIEHGKRHLSPKYLKLIDAAQVFTATQMQQLQRQVIIDMIRRHFGDALPPASWPLAVILEKCTSSEFCRILKAN